MSLGKPEIKQSNMTPHMEQFATEQAAGALSLLFHEQEVAQFVKNSFEKTYNPNWHCIVGRKFGAFVTHEVGNYIYFYIGQKGFLIWSTPS
jgi:dynein light chain LC8-type